MNAAKLQHVQFLGNCVIELYGVDLPTAYQHAFIFIRQLAMILREALNAKTKVLFSFKKIILSLCLVAISLHHVSSLSNLRMIILTNFLFCLKTLRHKLHLKILHY